MIGRWFLPAAGLGRTMGIPPTGTFGPAPSPTASAFLSWNRPARPAAVRPTDPPMKFDDDQKEALRKRLRRAEGQVAAVGRMIEEDRYCVDVLMQVRAAMAALGKVGHIVLENHMDTCVTDAFRADDDAARKAKVRELMEVFAKYGNFGGR